MAGTATLVPDGVWSAPVLNQDVQTSSDPTIPPKYTDQAVLSIVVQDFERASAWLNNRRWPLMWVENDILYQSPRSLALFEGSNVSRANVSRFTVAKQVNSLAPAISGAIFSDPTPFEIRPRPNTTQDTARAWKELISELLEKIDFKQEMSYGIQGMVNQGTVIFKVGWETETSLESHYRRKRPPEKVSMPLGSALNVITKESDEFEAVDVEITRNRPTFEKCELGSVFIDPTWKNPNQLWKANWIVHQRFLNYDDLTKLRDNPDYDIPSDEVLRFIFMNDGEQTKPIDGTAEALTANTSIHHAERPDVDFSEDPLQKPMEVLEWWDKTQVRTVLQQKVVIRKKPHRMPDKPFFSANYWDIENAGFGMGVGRIAGADQRVEQGCLNAILDILAFAVQPEYAIARGANVPTQEQRRRLGGIRLVDGDDATRSIALVPQPQVPPDTWRAIQAAISSSEAATGADQATIQGTLPPRASSIGSSGTGAGMISAASSGRLQMPVERVIDGVFLPFLRFLWQMVRERMPISEIRAILGERAQDLQVDFADFMDANVKFDTLAGTRLAARGRMAQALPFLLEVLGNQALVAQLAQIGWKVNALELTKMVLDMSEWKNQNDLIVQLTPQEQQTLAAQNPEVIKAQAQAAATQQNQQFQMALEDKKIAGRIAAKSINTVHQAAVESPMDRASSFAERTADERAMQGSQFFAPVGG
jgi:ligand-binding SRPBCC domain-containing protein